MEKTTQLFELDFDMWFEEFLPVVNFSRTACGPSISINEVEQSFGFETYGKDLEHVRAVANSTPSHVWTLVEEDGSLLLLAGYRLVNRQAYLITEKPWAHADQRAYIYKNDFTCTNCDWQGAPDDLMIMFSANSTKSTECCPECASSVYLTGSMDEQQIVDIAVA